MVDSRIVRVTVKGKLRMGQSQIEHRLADVGKRAEAAAHEAGVTPTVTLPRFVW